MTRVCTRECPIWRCKGDWRYRPGQGTGGATTHACTRECPMLALQGGLGGTCGTCEMYRPGQGAGGATMSAHVSLSVVRDSIIQGLVNVRVEGSDSCISNAPSAEGQGALVAQRPMSAHVSVFLATGQGFVGSRNQGSGGLRVRVQGLRTGQAALTLFKTTSSTLVFPPSPAFTLSPYTGVPTQTLPSHLTHTLVPINISTCSEPCPPPPPPHTIVFIHRSTYSRTR